MDEQDLYLILYSILISTCPVDTRNMLTNITHEDVGDGYRIVISGPTDNYDYAHAVNYNKQRTAKESRNFQWVERAIKQAVEVAGGILIYEL